MSDGKTDERTDSPAPKRRDMDSRFLAGCLTIAILSLAFWLMASWPFFVFPVYLKSGLLQALWFGGLPTLVVGLILVRIKGLEAGTALIGGSLSAGVFVFLHLGNLSLGTYAESSDLPPPDYPASWAWLIPLGWSLAVVALVLLALPKRETQDEAGPDSSRQ